MRMSLGRQSSMPKAEQKYKPQVVQHGPSHHHISRDAQSVIGPECSI